MPLPPAVPRQPFHRRVIECRGYQRADGLWDIEGHLVDTKDYALPTQARGTLAPGQPLHEMWLRLTVDDNFIVHAAIAVTDAAPFHICPDITPRFQHLQGVSIASGWHRKVRELLGGVKGCTHLVELLAQMATTAFQTIYPATRAKREREATLHPHRQPPMLDTCHAFARNSVVVKQFLPKFYTETEESVSE